MTDIEKRFRPARIDEADVLAELVDYAGEGLPSYLWGKMAGPGETAQEVGRRRAARETGTFSYRNATIIEYAGHAAGSLISYVDKLCAKPGVQLRTAVASLAMPIKRISGSKFPNRRQDHHPFKFAKGCHVALPFNSPLGRHSCLWSDILDRP
jgi:hypothetical protein